MDEINKSKQLLNLAGMVIKSVELCNIPQYSYWNAKPYNGNLTEKGAMVTKDAVLKVWKEEDVDPTTPTYSFYTPEYIGATELEHSYLLITATKDDRKSTYRFNLGHSVADGNYDLLRNYFYNITATVKGFGETDVDVKISVLNNKTMKNIINISALLCCIALLGACSKQSDDFDGQLRKGAAHLWAESSVEC